MHQSHESSTHFPANGIAREVHSGEEILFALEENNKSRTRFHYTPMPWAGRLIVVTESKL